MHVRKIYKVGNSLMIAVPPEMLDAIGGQVGYYMDWDYSKPGEYVLTFKVNRDRLAVPLDSVEIPFHPPVERQGGADVVSG